MSYPRTQELGSETCFSVTCYLDKGCWVALGACVISIGLGSCVMTLYHREISERMGTAHAQTRKLARPRGKQPRQPCGSGQPCGADSCARCCLDIARGLPWLFSSAPPAAS